MSTTLENLLNESDKEAFQYIEDVTSNAEEIQQRILTEILSINAHVEYLQHHGLNGCTDAATFKKLIPFVSYEDIKPYIDRIAYGDTSPILCSKPITEFFISSGTSGGEQKLIPMFDEEFKRRSYILNLVMPTMKHAFPGLYKGKGMYFGFPGSDYKTHGGIIASPLFRSLCRRSHFNNMPRGSFTTPNEVILCTDANQSLYCQLLFGLYQNQQVVRVGVAFASALIRAMKFLENNWLLFTNDIRTGTINPIITDPTLIESLMKVLKPNPELADFIESECKKGTLEGIIPRLWPNTKYIDAIVTGSMSQYIPIINYYSNGLPIVCNSYNSSESSFGVNLTPLCKPEEISYTLIPTMAYFEFLPVYKENEWSNSTDGAEPQELVGLVDVKLGQEYEIVVTTFAGLYRYCMGDILRVTGFKNKAPQFSFVSRKNVVLNLHHEKTEESELHKAVKEAAALLTPYEASLIDYTSYTDSSSSPGHYVVYWEIRKNEEISVPCSVYEECCVAVEESFGFVYRRARAETKIIDPLEIKIVESGTFDKLMDLAVSRGTAMTQYKTPRCVKNPQALELLNSKVIANFFSQKPPKWDPTRRHSLLSR